MLMAPVRRLVVGLTAADLKPAGPATTKDASVLLVWELAAPPGALSRGNVNKTIPTTNAADATVECRRLLIIGPGFLWSGGLLVSVMGVTFAQAMVIKDGDDRVSRCR